MHFAPQASQHRDLPWFHGKCGGSRFKYDTCGSWRRRYTIRMRFESRGKGRDCLQKMPGTGGSAAHDSGTDGVQFRHALEHGDACANLKKRTGGSQAGRSATHDGNIDDRVHSLAVGDLRSSGLSKRPRWRDRQVTNNRLLLSSLVVLVGCSYCSSRSCSCRLEITARVLCSVVVS